MAVNTKLRRESVELRASSDLGEIPLSVYQVPEWHWPSSRPFSHVVQEDFFRSDRVEKLLLVAA